MMNGGAKRREEERSHAKGAEDAEGKGRPRIEEDGVRFFLLQQRGGGLSRRHGERGGEKRW